MKKNVLTKILAMGIMVSFLSACTYKEMDFSEEENPISWEYKKRIEEVSMTNNSDEVWYVDYNVVILDKYDEIIYMEKFEKKEISSQDTVSHDLEDIKPEYIGYTKVASMRIDVVKIYDLE